MCRTHKLAQNRAQRRLGLSRSLSSLRRSWKRKSARWRYCDAVSFRMYCAITTKSDVIDHRISIWFVFLLLSYVLEGLSGHDMQNKTPICFGWRSLLLSDGCTSNAIDHPARWAPDIVIPPSDLVVILVELQHRKFS